MWWRWRKLKEKTEKRPGLLWRVLAVVAALLLVAAAVVAFNWKQIEKQWYPMDYTASVERWATEYNVDPFFVYAVIFTESSFNPRAESHAGARGLMQMTEDTFDWIKTKIAADEDLTFEDLYEPDTAIRFGVYFLSISMARYGQDMSTAAAAYHSGWGTVDGLLADSAYTDDGVVLKSFPFNQMSHYVNKINRHYEKYLRLYQ